MNVGWRLTFGSWLFIGDIAVMTSIYIFKLGLEKSNSRIKIKGYKTKKVLFCDITLCNVLFHIHISNCIQFPLRSTDWPWYNVFMVIHILQIQQHIKNICGIVYVFLKVFFIVLQHQSELDVHWCTLRSSIESYWCYWILFCCRSR